MKKKFFYFIIFIPFLLNGKIDTLSIEKTKTVVFDSTFITEKYKGYDIVGETCLYFYYKDGKLDLSKSLIFPIKNKNPIHIDSLIFKKNSDMIFLIDEDFKLGYNDSLIYLPLSKNKNHCPLLLNYPRNYKTNLIAKIKPLDSLELDSVKKLNIDFTKAFKNIDSVDLAAAWCTYLSKDAKILRRNFSFSNIIKYFFEDGKLNVTPTLKYYASSPNSDVYNFFSGSDYTEYTPVCKTINVGKSKSKFVFNSRLSKYLPKYLSEKKIKSFCINLMLIH